MKPRLWTSENGGIAIIVALLMPVLIGAAALASETGYWFMLQRQAQNAADMAAYTAGLRWARDDSDEIIRAGAESVTRGSGVPDTATVEVNFLSEDRVEVIVTDMRDRLFTRLFLNDPIALRGRAVAQITRGERGVPVCMLSLSPSSDRAVWLDGSASVSLPNCALEARSTSSSALFSGGSSQLTAACVNVAGGVSGNPVETTLCNNVQTGATVRGIPQQLQDLAGLPDAASVPNQGVSQVNNATLTPQQVGHPSGVPMMRFRGGVTFRNTVTLNRGIYIIDGGQLSTQGRTDIIARDGVAFYLMNGARLDFGNNTTADMQAMHDGPWQDVIIFDSQDAASRQTHVLVGSRVTGAIFTPQATIEFGGGTGVDSGCFLMVMDRFYFTGSAAITSDCTASSFDLDVYGGGAEGAAEVRLVE